MHYGLRITCLIILSSHKRHALFTTVRMIAVCSVLGRSCYRCMSCLTRTNMHERAFRRYLIAYSWCCCMKGHRSTRGVPWVTCRYHYFVYFWISDYLLCPLTYSNGISPRRDSYLQSATIHSTGRYIMDYELHFFECFGHQTMDSHYTLLYVWLLCAQCWGIAAIAVCDAWPVLICMKERSAIIWSLTAAVVVWKAIVQQQEGCQEPHADIIFYYFLFLNIDHYVLTVHKGTSSTPNFITSAKASDHVTTTLLEIALVHYQIAET